VGRSAAGGHGAFLSSLPFARLLADNVSFDHIDANLAAGRIGAVTVSATHVASGRTIVFAALAGGAPVDLGADPTMIARPVALRAPHVLASAAIPMLFPAVVVDGELYCDGGLRQLVPLRPAVRLGAHAIVVVSPRATLVPTEPANERAYSSPVYLLGKALDALLLDHVDADVERLEHLNRILAAGRRQFGPTFERELGAGLGPGVAELRTIASAVVRPSENLGCLAAEHVRSRRFARRACTPAGRLLRALADAEGGVETDLVSYLLFDGDYAGHLVDLGISDARARHDELCALLATADSARHAA
jgi:NTE family protein